MHVSIGGRPRENGTTAYDGLLTLGIGGIGVQAALLEGFFFLFEIPYY
jgi:hypothetical protein